MQNQVQISIGDFSKITRLTRKALRLYDQRSLLNPAYKEHELEHSLMEIGAETAVVLTPFYNKLKRLQKSTALPLNFVLVQGIQIPT